MSATSATPIISAAAVEPCVWGCASAFSRASSPVTPRNLLRGMPISSLQPVARLTATEERDAEEHQHRAHADERRSSPLTRPAGREQCRARRARLDDVHR